MLEVLWRSFEEGNLHMYWEEEVVAIVNI